MADEIVDLAAKALKDLRVFAEKNKRKNDYYYQKNMVKDYGINTPKELRNLEGNILGWPTLAVDVTLERIDFTDFYSPLAEDENAAWLNSIFNKNSFEARQKESQKDSMITGVSFISVSNGDPSLGEPEIVWRTENSSTMVVEYNPKTDRVEYAVKFIASKKNSNKDFIGFLEVLTPNFNVTFEAYANSSKSAQLIEVEVNEHSLGFVPIVPIFNNADSVYPRGVSEITRALESQTDSAMRTLRAAEIARELYVSPMRALLGGSPELVERLRMVGGKLVLPTGAGDIQFFPSTGSVEDGTYAAPSLTELTGGSPNNVLSLIEPYGRIAAREIGVIPSYMGFDTVNPGSADAINAADQKIIKKAQARIAQFRRAYKLLAEFSLRIAGREITEDFYEITPNFKNVDTPTPQAASDRIIKMKAAGVFDEELPDFVYDELNLSPIQKKSLKDFVESKQAAKNIASLAAFSQTPLGE